MGYRGYVMGKKYKYCYGICDQADKLLLKKQCIALEKNIPNLKKEELLEDVDGSQWQFYILENKEIVVRNDCCINELYIESDVDLLPYFNR